MTIANSVGFNGTFPASGTIATLDGTETLTNKTLTAPVISTISNTGTLTLPTATGNVWASGTRNTNTTQTDFLATVNSTLSNLTGNGTFSAVVFQNEYYDHGSNYNNATGIFTAPVTGVYWFGTYVKGIDYVGSFSVCQIIFYFSSNVLYVSQISSNNIKDSSNQLTTGGSVIRKMTAGDTVYVAFRVSGGSKIIDVDGTVGTSTFSGRLLC